MHPHSTWHLARVPLLTMALLTLAACGETPPGGTGGGSASGGGTAVGGGAGTGGGSGTGGGGSAPRYTVGGTVSGLSATGLVLQDNGGDDRAIASNGSFTFATTLADGAAYLVTVKTQPTGQTCSVSNGSGVIAGADVTTPFVTCVASAQSYTVSGTVTGLTGTGLVLQDNGADDLAVSASGAFTFATRVADQATYAVTVKTQPSGQTCTVSNGTGTILHANATGVSVTCAATSHPLGGTVTGLTGSGLILQNNGGDDLGVSASGSFTFSAPVAEGASYAVTVKTQPTGQTCTVSSGSGTMGSSAVTSVALACTSTFTIGGTITGLAGSMTIANNGTAAIIESSSGAWTLPTRYPAGTTYAVTVSAQPANQTCTVSNGTGTLGAANVTNVNITCATHTYSVGGTLSGLSGGSVVLQDNGGDDLTVSANGAFTFATKVVIGGSYAVTVKTQPSSPLQLCTVSSGSGVMPAANVTSVSVVCSTSVYTVGGTASGLSGAVVLRNNGGDDLTVSASGAFTFASRLANGAGYAVTVASTTGSQACVLANATGSVSGANVTGVTLTCAAAKLRFAYVPNGSTTIAVHGLDATTGAIRSSPLSVTAHKGVRQVVFNAAGTFAYAVNYGDANPGPSYDPGSVAAYSVDAATGGLTELAGSPHAAPDGAGNPTLVAVHPGGKFLYVLDFVGNTVRAYAIDQANGTLSAVGTPAITGTQPGSLTFDSGGAHLYVANLNDTTISGFTVNGTTGALTAIAGSPFTIPVAPGGGMRAPHGVQVASNGKLYATDYWGGLDVFSLDGAGVPSSISGSPVSTLPVGQLQGLVVTAGSTFLFTPSYNGAKVLAFAIAGSGLVSQVAGSPFSTITNPSWLALHPAGGFLYVAALPNQVAAYAINASTGALTPVPGSPFTLGFVSQVSFTP